MRKSGSGKVMHDYSQESKSIVRKKVLQEAINYLTIERRNSSIITEDYFLKMWEQAKTLLDCKIDRLNLSIDDSYKDQWLQLYKSRVGKKKAVDLKVIYLCGPSPMNDLKILIDCGIRAENIWAVEFDKENFNHASDELKDRYPLIKIYNGKFENFIEIYPDVYDIVYFDSCKSFPNKEQRTHDIIYNLFYNQKLSDLSVLITNFSQPDFTKDKIKNQFVDILATYFYPNKNLKNEDGELIIRTSPLECGELYTYDDMKEEISKDVAFYYQHFITSFVYDIATFYSPYSRVFQNKNLANIFLKQEAYLKNGKLVDYSEVKNIMKDIWGNKKINYQNENSMFSYGFMTNHYYPIYDFEQQFFIDGIKDNKEQQWFYNFFSKGNKPASIEESLAIAEFLTKKSLYIDKEYVDVLKSVFKDNVIKCMNNNIFFDSELHASVDVPMNNLVLQLLIYQIGFPYHMNIDKIKRYEYKAKHMTMYTDLFVMDKCRYLYDWIPTVDLFHQGFKNIELQLATRICIGKLCNKSGSVFSEIYKYGTFFSYSEEESNGFKYHSTLNNRNVIEHSNSEKDEIENLVNEIYDLVDCYKKIEEKNILLKQTFPCGYVSITNLDRRKKKVKLLIEAQKKYKDIFGIIDRTFYLSCYSNQSLEANKVIYSKVMNLLHSFGIDGKLESRID